MEPAVATRGRSRHVALGATVTFCILVVCWAYGSRQRYGSQWRTYAGVFQSAFLEIAFVILAWWYGYQRLSSAFPKLPREFKHRVSHSMAALKHLLLRRRPIAKSDKEDSGGFTDAMPSNLTHYSRLLLMAVFFVLWVPLAMVVIYPMGGWINPIKPEEGTGKEPFLFTSIGFATAAIFLQMLWVLIIVDILYHIYARIKPYAVRCLAAFSARWKQTSNAMFQKYKQVAPPRKLDAECGAQATAADIQREMQLLTVGEDTTSETQNADDSKQLDEPKVSAKLRCCCKPRQVSLACVEDSVLDAARTVVKHCTPRPLPVPLSIFVLALTVALCCWGFINGLDKPSTVHVEIPLSRLPAMLDGFKIVYLSDIHLGPTRGYSHLNDAVVISNGLHPDIVVIGGDLIDGHQDIVEPMLEPLSRLQSRYNRTYFVTGNHEYLEGSILVKESILSQRYGVVVLNNKWVAVPEGGPQNGTFDLLGVPDWAESKRDGPWVATDLPGAVADRNSSRELVAIAHQPWHAVQAGAAGAGLQISGHVHCGQLLPILPVAYLANPYFSGINRKDVAKGSSAAVDEAIAERTRLNPATASPSYASGAWSTFVYMSCGVYGWGPTFRQHAPHEVTEVVLRSTAVVGPDFQPVFKRVVCTGVGCNG